MSVLFSTLSASETVFRTQGVNTDLNQGAMQMLRYIGREIGEGNPTLANNRLTLTTDANGDSVITFQVPVDWDQDGDILVDGTTNTVEWGAYRFVNEPGGVGWLNRWTRYRVLNNQLLREILNTDGISINSSDVIIGSDVQAFNVSQINEKMQINLTLRDSDDMGQSGTARAFQTTFTVETLLRNNVS